MEATSPARSEQFAQAAIPGDFASGLRAPNTGVGPRGDFASGIRRSAMTQATGDFATGLRASTAGATRLGDFATGMRVHDAARPATERRPARGGLRRLQERIDPAT
jgi:hypothetical protein